MCLHRAATRSAALVALACLFLSSPGAIAGKKKPPARPMPSLVIEGRAIATTEPTPHCGIIAFAQKVRYEVLKVVKGKYTHAKVDVTHPCENVAVGTRRTLTLGPKPNVGFNYSVIGKLQPPHPPHYWLVP